LILAVHAWLAGSWQSIGKARPGEVERLWRLPLWEIPYVYGPQGARARARARVRARDVARSTLGEDRWAELQRQGYLDVTSTHLPGLTYRLRVGRRIEVLCAPGVESPWPYPYLCINPTYPLPEEEFFAQLYLYVRDDEDLVLKVAAPQPWDDVLGRTF
jgi:hypothetical protein